MVTSIVHNFVYSTKP